MPMFAVDYVYSPATIPGRDEHRPAHRDWLRGQAGAGVVASVGAYADGSGALVLVNASTPEEVAAILADDPFAVHNLLESVRIREWKPTIGAFAG